MWRRRLVRAALWTAAFYGALLSVIQYTPMADWLVRPLVVQKGAGSADVIVLLTAWAAPDGTLNQEGVYRTLEAARLFESSPQSRVIISGHTQAAHSGDPALAMFQMLRQLNVPSEAQELERESTNTRESAVNVARRVKALGRSRVWLVTDAEHMTRAQKAFEKAGLEVVPAPTMEWTLWWAQPYDRERKFFGAVHEYVGLLYYWLRGWV